MNCPPCAGRCQQGRLCPLRLHRPEPPPSSILREGEAPEGPSPLPSPPDAMSLVWIPTWLLVIAAAVVFALILTFGRNP